MDPPVVFHRNDLVRKTINLHDADHLNGTRARLTNFALNQEQDHENETLLQDLVKTWNLFGAQRGYLGHKGAHGTHLQPYESHIGHCFAAFQSQIALS